MKTIKITTVGSAHTGKRNLLMAFEHPDFQKIAYPSLEDCFLQYFRRELLIDGEKIDVRMIQFPGDVCLIYIKIGLNCI